jgi:hypothetical protein
VQPGWVTGFPLAEIALIRIGYATVFETEGLSRLSQTPHSIDVYDYTPNLKPDRE